MDEIKASDLLKLMDIVDAATALWNRCEQQFGARWNCAEFRELSKALKAFGLPYAEVE